MFQRPEQVRAPRPPCARCGTPVEQDGHVWGFQVCDCCFVAWGEQAPENATAAELQKFTAEWVDRGVAS